MAATSERSKVKERGIIFTGPSIRAVQRGQKTQTRRPIPVDWWRCLDADDPDDRRQALGMCPYGKPGERLWVREAHAIGRTDDGREICAYRAACVADHFDYVTTDGALASMRVQRWTSARYMPRRAARMLLELTDVRIELLQGISEEDARAEGIRWHASGYHHVEGMDIAPHRRAARVFACLWDSINSKRAPWESNPWVWALTFRKLKDEVRT
jgi:hypothetical protein